MLAGKEALFKVQLTQVQDGSVLGFSFSHGMSGEQACRAQCRQKTQANLRSSNALSRRLILFHEKIMLQWQCMSSVL